MLSSKSHCISGCWFKIVPLFEDKFLPFFFFFEVSNRLSSEYPCFLVYLLINSDLLCSAEEKPPTTLLESNCNEISKAIGGPDLVKTELRHFVPAVSNLRFSKFGR